MRASRDRLYWLLCGLTSCTGAATSAAPRATEPAASAQQACSALLLDDWEDGDLRATPGNGPSGAWHSYRDPNGSTLTPEQPFAPAHGGAHGSRYAGHIAGKLASGSPVWAGMEDRFGDPATAQDLSPWRRVCFQAKGVGRARFEMPDVNTDQAGAVCQRCYNHFGANFPLSADWQEHCFAFDSLTQDCCWGEARPAVTPQKVFALSWSVRTPGADYDLWIDDVQLRCD